MGLNVIVIKEKAKQTEDSDPDEPMRIRFSDYPSLGEEYHEQIVQALCDLLASPFC